jgi:hypothetical protein
MAAPEWWENVILQLVGNGDASICGSYMIVTATSATANTHTTAVT